VINASSALSSQRLMPAQSGWRSSSILRVDTPESPQVRPRRVSGTPSAPTERHAIWAHPDNPQLRAVDNYGRATLDCICHRSRSTVQLAQNRW
jgi:hypothetical protein